jgi:uncharacterized cupredoxin-like copper-binding protein
VTTTSRPDHAASRRGCDRLVDDRVSQPVGGFLSILAVEIAQVPPLLDRIREQYRIDQRRPGRADHEERRVVRRAQRESKTVTGSGSRWPLRSPTPKVRAYGSSIPARTRCSSSRFVDEEHEGDAAPALLRARPHTEIRQERSAWTVLLGRNDGQFVTLSGSFGPMSWTGSCVGFRYQIQVAESEGAVRVGRVLIAGWALIAGVGLLSGCGSSSKSSSPSTATTTSISDSGSTAPASGATIHVTVGDTKGLEGPMTLVASPPAALAGDVTFVVKNTGTIDHEVIVLKTNVPYDKLPVVDAGDPPARVTTGANKVDEATSVGETGDPNVKPGGTRTFTVKNMTAGKYALVCNIAVHYDKGMRAAFNVTS